MSASPSVLQKLIDICVNYSLHNSSRFYPTKSVCIAFNPKMFTLHCPTMTLNDVFMEYETNIDVVTQSCVNLQNMTSQSSWSFLDVFVLIIIDQIYG